MTRVGLSVFTGLLLACSHPGHEASASQAAADDFLIVPGVRVGRFEIGRDTATSILGADTPEARKHFHDRGFEFQFDRGRELTGITVLSPEYATSQGFRVGTRAADIEAALGAPLRRVVRDTTGRKLEIPTLLYDDIGFILGTDSVLAIWVGQS